MRKYDYTTVIESVKAPLIQAFQQGPASVFLLRRKPMCSVKCV